MLIFLLTLAQAKEKVAEPAPVLPEPLREQFGDLPFVGKFGLLPKISKNAPKARSQDFDPDQKNTECSVAIVVAKNGKVEGAEVVTCAENLVEEALRIAVDIRYEKPEVMGKKQPVWTIRTFAVGMFHKL